MQFSPACYYFIPLRSKYSPQHPVLKHLQSVFFKILVKIPEIKRPVEALMRILEDNIKLKFKEIASSGGLL
jgi:hypothetical protein